MRRGRGATSGPWSFRAPPGPPPRWSRSRRPSVAWPGGGCMLSRSGAATCQSGRRRILQVTGTLAPTAATSLVRMSRTHSGLDSSAAPIPPFRLKPLGQPMFTSIPATSCTMVRAAAAARSVRGAELHHQPAALLRTDAQHQAVVPPVDVVDGAEGRVDDPPAGQQALVDRLLQVDDVGSVLQYQHSEGRRPNLRTASQYSS